MSKNVDFQKTKDCVAVLNACLPEVLRRVFVVNAPFVFQVLAGPHVYRHPQCATFFTLLCHCVAQR